MSTQDPPSRLQWNIWDMTLHSYDWGITSLFPLMAHGIQITGPSDTFLPLKIVYARRWMMNGAWLLPLPIILNSNAFKLPSCVHTQLQLPIQQLLVSLSSLQEALMALSDDTKWLVQHFIVVEKLCKLVVSQLPYDLTAVCNSSYKNNFLGAWRYRWPQFLLLWAHRYSSCLICPSYPNYAHPTILGFNLDYNIL